jgi:hypothetical protein
MRRCFVRDIQRPAELLLASYWNEHRVDVRSDGVFVVKGFRSITTVKGYAFFVWKPDLAKNWPTLFTAPAPQQSLLEELPQGSAPQAEEPKLQAAIIQPKDWLFGEFGRTPCSADGQAKYLHDIHERINKDKSVRRRQPISLKTVQNRYAEWKELSKRQPK